jgi:hypothetical protein
MKFLLLLPLLGLKLLAQPTATLVVPNNAKAGTTIQVVAGQNGMTAVGTQFILSINPPTAVTAIVGTPTAAMSSEQLNCGNYSNGSFNCILFNPNVITLISPGAEINYAVTLAKNISGTVTFTFSQVYEVDANGGGIAVATPFPVSSTLIISACDLNNDGVINITDYSLELGWALGTGSIPVGSSCDVNNDGVCNLLDVFIIAKAMQPGGVCNVGIAKLPVKKKINLFHRFNKK